MNKIEFEPNIYDIIRRNIKKYRKESEIKAFFKALRRGDIQNLKYKKMIINVLVDKVYLYDDHITTIYTIQNENGERVKAHLPTIEEIEKSFEKEE